MEDDEAGRMAGFRARFGKSFDAQKDSSSTSDTPASKDAAELVQETSITTKGVPDADAGLQSGPFFRQASETKHAKGGSAIQDEEYYEFEEDDANLLDLISSYGQEVAPPKETPAPASGKKGKK